MHLFPVPYLLLTTVLLASASSLTLTSCSSDKLTEGSLLGRRAIDRLETYVSAVETNPARALPDSFATRLTAAQQYATPGDTTQQTQIRRLAARYHQAQRASLSSPAPTSADPVAAAAAPVAAATAREAPAPRYKTRTSAAALTAANARQTYEAFVQHVQANEDHYDLGDWRAVNADWRALDQQYDQIKDNVSGNDKAEIAKEKLKYAAFKSFDKAKGRVSQAGDVVSGNPTEAKAKGGGVHLKQTAKNVRADAGRLAQDAKQTGKDIGHGTKETGQEVGQGAAKVGKKVGGAVKEVFHGKDDKQE
ncbi:DUF6565 domain-containing protein [Hymenobacter sp. YC55]|uniref:DUF6565 domain-containing protein n=1 Tax=Hymenobacter sp. YC55 TaxID=3034019 RepID=UPI0023F9E2C0|nr:DUF6565 domain-containing protein [Hymenobacter sp. YC55]MDF7813858.1 hypothetical protein [Hymenobacter sp. YC55]